MQVTDMDFPKGFTMIFKGVLVSQDVVSLETLLDSHHGVDYVKLVDMVVVGQ